MNDLIEVTDFPLALCPGTAQINIAVLQEPAFDFPASTSLSYRLVRPDRERSGAVHAAPLS